MNPLHGKVSNFQSFIHRWQSLRSVPFRRRFFVGYDLDGNSYWEFYVDGNKDVRPRRIVDYREQKQNWVDYKMPPQWVQWLRFARPNHPTLEELYADKVRQEVLKVRVKEAEERWKSVPLKKDGEEGTGSSTLEMLLKKHKEESEKGGDSSNYVMSENNPGINEPVKSGPIEKEMNPSVTNEELIKQRSNPSQEFTPEEWSPSVKR